ncbi:hypothetical protein GCM10017771_27200 [Streptomyces capitiformicae]|uniref:Uncharacterized protein n=1 Tax=Streptomyces capitiformicae TaxID=2014920 RepID=A0A919L917_9ACTN|nr:hypothetical protein GCM10017771_27200 [Streptomyces capitiformicae]
MLPDAGAGAGAAGRRAGARAGVIALSVVVSAEDAKDAEDAWGAADAVAGRAVGRARAAAQVTPIEEARNRELRIRLILGIVIHICPSRN